MSDIVNRRKLEHIKIVQEDDASDRRKFYFDDVRLTHRALPEIRLDDVDASIVFMGKCLSFPLLISSMTGGHHDEIVKINRNLAIAAEKTGVALGVGSQRVMFTEPKARASFALREVAPSALLFSNLGAVQLNYGLTHEMCRDAINVLKADALYLHLNPLQEAAQPEGNTDFGSLSTRISALAAELDKPIILKEVGAGVSPADVELAIQCGVRYIDVAGAGGTSWARIEGQRDRENVTHDVGSVFQDWGIPTPTALRLLDGYRDRVTLIASGGIRSGLDMAKAVVLGASLCGMARPFLAPACESAEAVVSVIESLREQFRTSMFLMGLKRVDEMCGQKRLLIPSTSGGH
ncbi:MAG: type 2 isopentenyl-diphosphate Delta-isomerase [Verrucomicrobia bacterium]|nr:type 2 isopentenyl-diphosphate Delta-isomerase [Verrucomicrobiota bacterium]